MLPSTQPTLTCNLHQFCTPWGLAAPPTTVPPHCSARLSHCAPPFLPRSCHPSHHQLPSTVRSNPLNPFVSKFVLSPPAGIQRGRASLLPLAHAHAVRSSFAALFAHPAPIPHNVLCWHHSATPAGALAAVNLPERTAGVCIANRPFDIRQSVVGMLGARRPTPTPGDLPRHGIPRSPPNMRRAGRLADH